MGLFIFTTVFLEASTVPGSQKSPKKYMLNKWKNEGIKVICSI